MLTISELINGEISEHTAENVMFDDSYDVIVSGLGTAGSYAALFSAENGLKVLGIEAFNTVGGTSTIGGIQGHYFGCPGGRYVDYDNKAYEFMDAHALNRIESSKYILENAILDSGAHILYESVICGIYKEENTVVGVRVFSDNKFKNYTSKVVMDCTGDAHTAYMAGCETEYGRETDGLTQPYTSVSCYRTEKGFACTNIDFGRVDQRDDKALSKATIFSRSFDIDKSHVNGKFLMHLPLLGIREGRRIIPEEPAILKDVFENTPTKEPMFYSYSDLDKHGWDIAFDGTEIGDWAIGANLGAFNITVAVPWKAIIPKGMNGILVPCRALGVDRNLSSCVRMVVDMKKLAEVGADVASIAIKENCQLKDIPYSELEKMLTKSGCLDKAFDRGIRIDGTRDYDGSPLTPSDVSFFTDPSELEKPLSSNKPGIAIWSAKQMGERCIETLKKLLSSDNEDTRKHSSFALSATGDESGVLILRDMVQSRDDTMLTDCRKLNQYRGCMAMYYLGKFGDAEITDTLITIISDPAEEQRYVCNTEFSHGIRYKVEGFNNKYFQFASNAVMALVRIGNKTPSLREKISLAFEKSLGDYSYCKRFTTLPDMSSEGMMVRNIRNIAFSAIKHWNKH